MSQRSAPDGACGKKHRVGGSEVVAAPFGDEHDDKRRHKMHPAEEAIALPFRIGKNLPEADEEERRSDQVDVVRELTWEKVICPAPANVAGVNASQKFERDEVMSQGAIREPTKMRARIATSTTVR